MQKVGTTDACVFLFGIALFGLVGAALLHCGKFGYVGAYFLAFFAPTAVDALFKPESIPRLRSGGGLLAVFVLGVFNLFMLFAEWNGWKGEEGETPRQSFFLGAVPLILLFETLICASQSRAELVESVVSRTATKDTTESGPSSGSSGSHPHQSPARE